MTQLFTERGTVVPVTVLESDSCRVVQSKSAALDGYDAVQLGFGEMRRRKANKPTQGHFKAAGLQQPLRTLREIRDAGTPELGAQLRVDMFQAGDKVDVIGVTKGKGFAGTVKRHNFSRGPSSHGSMNIRQPGSIGSVDAARTFKGMRMAGHLGSAQRTIRGLEVVRVDGERNLLLVKGSVPGHRNAVVLVRDSDREATLA